ncbi:hypothetical protein V8E51_004544 [Hyaloscypha variabilis]
MQLAIRRSIFSFARMAAKELAFREPRGGKNSIWAKEDSPGPCIPSSQDARFPAGLRTDDIDWDGLSIGCLGVSCFPGCLDPPALHMSMSCPTPNTLATRRRQRLIGAREDYAFVFREPTKCAQTRNESIRPHPARP